jgi:hypothetical protein
MVDPLFGLNNWFKWEGPRTMTGSNKVSRRRLLTVAVGMTGAATSAAFIGTTTPAHAKVAQKAVKYQEFTTGE